MIWEKWQAKLEPLRATLNAALGKSWEEWEIPREAGDGLAGRRRRRRMPSWWEPRIARQKEIDDSIAKARRCRDALRPAL